MTGKTSLNQFPDLEGVTFPIWLVPVSRVVCTCLNIFPISLFVDSVLSGHHISPLSTSNPSTLLHLALSLGCVISRPVLHNWGRRAQAHDSTTTALSTQSSEQNLPSRLGYEEGSWASGTENFPNEYRVEWGRRGGFVLVARYVRCGANRIFLPRRRNFIDLRKP